MVITHLQFILIHFILDSVEIKDCTCVTIFWDRVLSATCTQIFKLSHISGNKSEWNVRGKKITQIPICGTFYTEKSI